MLKHSKATTYRNRAPNVFRFIFIAIFTGMTALCLAYLRGDAPQEKPTQDESKSMQMVSGEFEVKIIPSDTGDSQMGMMLLDKQYLGALKATGNGRMLTGMTNVKNSAGYVAIERVEGELEGRMGSFLIQHSGTMSKGTQTLIISVVPDSGTGDLAGIEGTMDIRIENRKHFYDFRYRFLVEK